MEFVAARTAELHRTAYLLTADQDRAERLVAAIVAGLRRDRAALGQAGTAARQHMARLAAGATEAGGSATPVMQTEERFTALWRLSPRQRAVLLLRSLERYDDRSTARELVLPANAVSLAEAEAGQALGLPPDSDRCRALLTDFAQQATWPEPAVTLAAAQTTRSRRRSRGRYAAAAAVLAITAAAPISSQVAHDRWLHTPAGINALHGTHFRAYVQGYKLVDVHRVPAGARRPVDVSSGQVIALGCDRLDPTSQAGWPRIRDADGLQAYPCAKETSHRFYLFSPHGTAMVSAPHGGHQAITVASYQPVPWNRYPVVTGHFEVEHDRKLDLSSPDSDTTPIRAGRTRTLRGTNGTFMTTVQLPPPAKNTELVMNALLSPSTTGQYKVTIDGDVLSDCAPIGASSDGWCRLYDRYVPQLPFGSMSMVGSPSDPDSSPRTATVRVQVRDALGPWKLQVRYDRYRTAN